ncbi:MAG: beta-lactamase family protein [Clostridia bacterium]|nr:beta-lactamase family protein [Clostridia bacterium]
MKHLEKQIEAFFSEKIIHNLAVRIGKGDDRIYENYYSDERAINEKTRFDMASVSKVLATTTISLMALEAGKIHLEDRVLDYFAGPDDKQEMTIQHLLTHTMAIGHTLLNIPGNNNENIPEYILGLPCAERIGTRVRYSCLGFILLGRILEKVYGKRLDVLFQEMVAVPLGMSDTRYCPENKENLVQHNLDDGLLGVVNDRNCRYLDGVAGNAGIFSNMADMTKFVSMLRRNGAPLFSREILDLASRNYTAGLGEGRGLGFLYVDENYAQTGGLFPNDSIGHCGHTGQSFFLHRESGLYVILLTDATISTVKKYGEKNYYEKVKLLREKIHAAIKMDLQEKGMI